METSEILIRFLITFLSAFLFGIERQRSHKPIGFGTFIFVSIGSCGLAITALDLGERYPHENTIPLLSAIVTGIGFLGAGALIKTTDKIFGFTTAASIWAFSIYGLIIGVGEYLIGMMVYVILWTVIAYDKFLEKRGIGSYQKKITISTNRIVDEGEVREVIKTARVKLIKTKADVNEGMTLTYIRDGPKDDMKNISDKLLNEDWFKSIRIE